MDRRRCRRQPRLLRLVFQMGFLMEEDHISLP